MNIPRMLPAGRVVVGWAFLWACTGCSDADVPAAQAGAGSAGLSAGGSSGAGAAGASSGGAVNAAGTGSSMAGSAGLPAQLGGAGSGGSAGAGGGDSGPKLPHILIDSDANNEMDDQHAIAYALFNADVWHIDGITTNSTDSGGPAAEHTQEAERIVKLCASDDTVKVYTGATGDYDAIKGQLGQASFDGKAAVDFIIQSAKARSPQDKLILVPIGKLTNVALAFDKDPTILANIRVLWLGSNWPNPGEYNLENDPASASRVVDSEVELDIATVRYDGQPQPGTASVTVTLDQMKQNMTGKGPTTGAVEGRNGGTFTRFGDYSVDLMSHIGQVRALYDMAAVAILKKPAWATVQELPAPKLTGISWSARPDNQRKVRFWHSFAHDPIVADLFTAVAQPQLQK